MIRKRYLYPAAVTAVLAFMLSAPLSLPVHAEKQGTDGTEVQVVQPEELEVRLGKEWAGIRFTLETDAGKYPGTVTVGEDGVLRAQIGGSSRYLFSVTGSADRESGKKGEEDKNPWDREEDGGPEEDTMATDEGTENSEGGSVTAGTGWYHGHFHRRDDRQAVRKCRPVYQEGDPGDGLDVQGIYQP